MVTYTIKVFNQAGANKSYVAFMAQPTVTSKGGVTPVYTNAWVPFERITPGGFDTATYTESTYAYWAQPVEQMSPSTTVDSGGVMAMNTGTQDQITFSNTGATGFVGVPVQGKAQSGSFSIVTGSDFTSINGFTLGLASDSGTPIPSPVATFDALPNEVYNITPVVKFYVADGLYEAGAVIDYSAVSAKSAAIDFTGQSYTTATVVQDAHGVFSVSYS